MILRIIARNRTSSFSTIKLASHPSDGLEEEPEPATTFAFGPDPRRDNNNNKRSVPNVRLSVWYGKRRRERGAHVRLDEDAVEQ